MGIKCPQDNPEQRRKLELANDVESNPGPRSPEKKPRNKTRMRRSKSTAVDSGISSDSCAPIVGIEKKVSSPEPHDKDDTKNVIDAENEAKKISELEGEILALQKQLAGVDDNVERLLAQVETLRPLYSQAQDALSKEDMFP